MSISAASAHGDAIAESPRHGNEAPLHGFSLGDLRPRIFLLAFFILSIAVKWRSSLTPGDLFMSHFMQSALTLGGCIGAFTLIVAMIEMLS